MGDAIKRKHEIFIEEFIANGNDGPKAYQKAYPKASVESARVKSYTLLKDATIQREIVTRQKDLAALTQKVAIQAVQDEFTGRVLSLARKRELLAAIAEGEILIPNTKFYWSKKLEKHIALKTWDVPTHATRIAAIELDARIAGEIAPSKLFAAVQSVNEEGDLDGSVRMFVLSNGERIPLFGQSK